MKKVTTEIQKAHKGEITLNDVQGKIITIQNKNVLLDSDVAVLYGVETKRINEAIKNNPDKFPHGYIIPLEKDEWQILKSKISTTNKECKSLTTLGKQELVENFDRFNKLKHSAVAPKAFTEKGLYMLATILKSEKATDTTIAIVEAFAKMRELSTAVAELVQSPADTQKQIAVTQKSNEILSELVTKDLKTTGTETTYEFNLLSAVKIKHIVRKELK